MLSDLRLTVKISSWFEPNGRTRADNIPFGDICIGERMEKGEMNLSRIGSCAAPDQDVISFFSAHPEVGRAARPPTSPYAVEDSLVDYPLLTSDGPRANALGKWRNGRKSFNRFMCDQDVSMSQYMLYRMRFSLAGDLMEAWGGFWLHGGPVQPHRARYGYVHYGPPWGSHNVWPSDSSPHPKVGTETG